MNGYRHAVVTGGAGFLGSHVCARLIDEDWRVTCIDNFLSGVRDNVGHLLDCPAFTVVEADCAQPFVAREHADLVLHLASPASPAFYLRYPVETMTAGSAGTLNALELAERDGARFVLASTSEAYGDPLVHPQPENYWGNVNPVGPRAVYDEAKRYAEALTTAFRTSRGVNTAIVRIFNTYGPRMRLDDGRAIPTFIRQALAGDPVTVTGDGSQTRSVCFVDDTVAGLLAVAESDLAGPVNIGNPDEATVVEIARRVISAAGSTSEIEYIAAAADDPRVRRPDTTLIESRLGWRPSIDWDDGIARTIAWFRDQMVSTRDTAVGATS